MLRTIRQATTALLLAWSVQAQDDPDPTGEPKPPDPAVKLAEQRAKFEELARAYADRPAERAKIVPEIAGLIERAVEPARKSFDLCEEWHELFESQRRMLDPEKAFQPALEKFHGAWF